MVFSFTQQIIASIHHFFRWCPILPTILLDAMASLGPSIGYLDQLKNMLKEKTSENFKMNSSILLLLANTIRIIYFSQKTFPSYLLVQSIWMVFLNLTLGILYYYYKPTESKEKEFDIDVVPSTDLESDSEATEVIHTKCKCRIPFHIRFETSETMCQFFSSYTFFIFMMFIWTVAFTFLFGRHFAANFNGVLSNTIDCFVQMPPFIIVCFKRKIQYVTPLLVVQWFFAVFFKLTLYIFDPVPWPFILGLAIQAIFTFGVTFSYIQIKLCGEDSCRFSKYRESEQKQFLSAPLKFQDISSEVRDVSYQENAIAQQE